MSTNKFFRIAGWCSLVGALSMVIAVVFFMLSGQFPIAGIIGGILEYISLLLMIIVFYALYVALRSESKVISLAGMILLVVAIVVDIIANLNYGNTTLGNLWYLMISLPFLIYGFLALQSPRMSRGLAVVGFLTGVTYFISGAGGLLGSQNLADSISSISAILMLVWLVWLWRVLWSQKIVAALPIMQPA
jgi:hypothetical protein